MSDLLRERLTELSKRVDYSSPGLRKQIEAVDLLVLSERVERVQKRVQILSHAFDMMREAIIEHPMAAFLHACECCGPISDSEFYSLMRSWAMLCDTEEPGEVPPAQASMFARFMQAE